MDEDRKTRHLNAHNRRTEAVRILRAVTLGEDPANDRYALRSGATMSEMLDQYVTDMQSGKINGKKFSTIKSYKSRIETHIRPHLGKLKITAITQDHVEQLMNRCSPGSARRVVALFECHILVCRPQGAEKR
jgi:Phage integrase, N-terminal SAM-like domain